jgi:hypothetical protein
MVVTTPAPVAYWPKIARSGSDPLLAMLAWGMVIAGPPLGIAVFLLTLGECGWPGRKIQLAKK